MEELPLLLKTNDSLVNEPFDLTIIVTNKKKQVNSKNKKNKV